MKLTEVMNTWYVATKKTRQKVFTGTKGACIDFIHYYDQSHDVYVDLRLYDGEGKEFDYHKNEYVK